MGIRTLRIEGDPLLRKKSKPIREMTEKYQRLLDDMVDSMIEDHGIGLAAPQVGILRRLIVVDVGQGLYKMANPEIIEASSEQTLDIEGCLSVPEFNATVYRPKRIRVRYLDERGKEQEVEAEDLFARCICHEIDHLDGILFRDRVDRIIDMNHLDEETRHYLVEHGIVEGRE